jgi:basic membrane lipoprotein Med (substrate-binding protein (PBP1-ABC) superfamily)
MNDDYKRALSLGQKEYRSCVSRGEYPYLSVLDELLPPERQSMGTDLGLMQIPAHLIVGTKTAGRTTAFARNFMPLLAEGTEFSNKWERLCQAHLKEGIRDPVKVYEYMNRYYVQEGNKRVSVLKYFDAVAISANVIRILPERSDSPEVQAYFALCDFFRYSRVNYLEFSKAESYALFQRLVGKEPQEHWSEQDRRGLNTLYYYFQKAYQAHGGERLRTTVGDALLSCVNIYGYQALRSMGETELKKAVGKVWAEITLQQEERPIDLKLEAEQKPPLLPRLPIAQRPLKVAFLYDKTPETSGWTYSHELGRQHVERVLRGKVETTAYFCAQPSNSAAVLEEAISDGNRLLFTATPQMLPSSLRVAVDHPEINILNCSLNQSHRYIRTYYARMYEAKFVLGAVAGAMADSNRVGYICDYPIYGMIAGINAFARGVQMVNPRAKVFLEWSSTDGLAAATHRLTDRGIDLISTLDMARLEDGIRSNFGLAKMNSDGQVNLAMPVWDWGVYYEKIIRSVLTGSFRNEEEERALNYYYGMKEGVVDVLLSKSLPSGVQKLALVLKSAIVHDLCYPFFGPLVTQEGKTVLDSISSTIPVEQVISMDWLLDNVVGEIPAYEQLNPEAQATVDQAGVERAKKKQ